MHSLYQVNVYRSCTKSVTVAVAVAFLRRESKAVICRRELFRRDPRSLIGASQLARSLGRVNTDVRSQGALRVVPQGSSERH